MLKNIKQNIASQISLSIKQCIEKNELPASAIEQIILLEIPPQKNFGDLSCPISMQLARIAKKSPNKIAETIIKNFPQNNNSFIEKIDIAGAGFINFHLNKKFYEEILKFISQEKNNYGKSNIGQGKKIQVEFVSANPTGPLHIGHGRGAAIGDTLANVFKNCGYNVVKEYYINDVGNQMRNLGASTQFHYYKIFNTDIPFPENGYKGEYIREIALEIKNKFDNQYFTSDVKDSIPFFIRYTADSILDGIKKDLEIFGVKFDVWFSESSLHEDGTVKKMLNSLKEKDFLYDKDGALWLKTDATGDDKDRVVVSKEGKTTYLASDIAYHYNKFQRGFDKIINIWGADHHGYVSRIKATVKALGYDENNVDIILYQLVNLLRNGKQVAMSTRSGEFVSLSDVLDEVGKDVSRFYFLMRSSDSHLDFDLELAKKESAENPVYYIQYANARIASILNEAYKKKIDINDNKDIDLSLLKEDEEIELIKKLSIFPEIVESVALNYELHKITNYLQELAGTFHPYYNKHRVINDDIAITKSRLMLLNCTKIVITNALEILGVTVPEKM